MNLELLTQANHEWEVFLDSLNNDEKNGLVNLVDSIESNNLFYYAASKNTIKFDQTLNKLSKRYLFDEEIIPVIYDFYIERDLHELAFDYINKARDFLVEGKE